MFSTFPHSRLFHLCFTFAISDTSALTFLSTLTPSATFVSPLTIILFDPEYTKLDRHNGPGRDGYYLLNSDNKVCVRPPLPYAIPTPWKSITKRFHVNIYYYFRITKAMSRTVLGPCLHNGSIFAHSGIQKGSSEGFPSMVILKGILNNKP